MSISCDKNGVFVTKFKIGQKVKIYARDSDGKTGVGLNRYAMGYYSIYNGVEIDVPEWAFDNNLSKFTRIN